MVYGDDGGAVDLMTLLLLKGSEASWNQVDLRLDLSNLVPRCPSLKVLHALTLAPDLCELSTPFDSAPDHRIRLAAEPFRQRMGDLAHRACTVAEFQRGRGGGVEREPSLRVEQQHPPRLPIGSQPRTGCEARVCIGRHRIVTRQLHHARPHPVPQHQ